MTEGGGSLQDVAGCWEQVEQGLIALAEATPNKILYMDRDRRVVFINRHLAMQLNLEPERVAGQRIEEIRGTSQHSEPFWAGLNVAYETREVCEIDCSSVSGQSGPRASRVQFVPRRGQDGNVVGVIAVGRDVTDPVEVQRQRQRCETEFKTLADNLPDSVIRYDRDLRRLYINPAAQSYGGSHRNFDVGMTTSQGSPVVNLDYYNSVVREVFETGKPQECELFVDMDGTGKHGTFSSKLVPEYDEEGAVHSVLAIARDVTTLVQQRQRIQTLAYSDPLTGLANRAVFQERLREMLVDARQLGGNVALLLFDLDYFKDVNDTYGHTAGDELLVQIAERLKSCIRPEDTLARLGGDEFALLFGGVASHQLDLAQVAIRLKSVMQPVFSVAGVEIPVSFSIGVALLRASDVSTVDQLFTCADEALYEAKRRGRNNFQFYHEDFSRRTSEKVALGQSLRKAVENRELKLVYQPKCRLSDGKIVGIEALLRWQHPQLGLLLPDRFLHVAEENGSIVEIGDWVMEEACRAIVGINSGGKSPLKMTVNVSQRQLQDEGFDMRVSLILMRTHCEPNWLELDITETPALRGSDMTPEALSAVVGLGVTVAVDDFGTGQSSLAFLERFKVHALKIDRSFVSGTRGGSRREAILKASLSLADAFQIETVAEGVETAEQAAALLKMGCSFGQGFHFGRAMPLEALCARFGLVSGRGSGQTLN